MIFKTKLDYEWGLVKFLLDCKWGQKIQSEKNVTIEVDPPGTRATVFLWSLYKLLSENRYSLTYVLWYSCFCLSSGELLFPVILAASINWKPSDAKTWKNLVSSASHTLIRIYRIVYLRQIELMFFFNKAKSI